MISRDILRKMRDMGLTLDQAIELLDAMSAKEPSAAARRQRAYRERHQNITRDVTGDETRDATERDEPPLSLSPPPQTPPPHTHTPPDITTHARDGAFAKPNGFARFWEAYPNKVGKAAAEKSFATACRKIGGPDPPSVLMDGLDRAKVSQSWLDGYIPHPTTWLNRGSWEDQPSEKPPTRKANEQHHPDQRNTARQDGLIAHQRGAMAALDRRLNPVG